MDFIKYCTEQAALTEADLKSKDRQIAILERQKKAIEQQIEAAYTEQAQIAGAYAAYQGIIETSKKEDGKNVNPPA